MQQEYPQVAFGLGATNHLQQVVGPRYVGWLYQASIEVVTDCPQYRVSQQYSRGSGERLWPGPRPQSKPTTTEYHSVAAVFRPRACTPSFIITPTPKNPTPDTM